MALLRNIFMRKCYVLNFFKSRFKKMLEKMKNIVGSVTACVIAGIAYGWIKYDFAFLVPMAIISGVFLAIILGVTATIMIHLKLSLPHKVDINVPKKISNIQATLMNFDCKLPNHSQAKQSATISRKIDAAINEMLDCFFEATFIPLYTGFVKNSEASITEFRNILWRCITTLHERLSRIDHVRFFTCEVVPCLTHHLEIIRIAEAAGGAKGERGVFHLCSQLSSPVRERNFLRLVAEFLIIKVLPSEYHKSILLRNLIKEFIACKVLEPLIDHVCNPDWINQQLLQYLRQQQVAEELGRKTYHYAASYEDFINLIHDSTEISDLKHLRRNIINEIMQATAINNLKKAKGIDTSRETTPQSTGKGDLLQARNLKRYINQLTYAKAQCERRISKLAAKPATSNVNNLSKELLSKELTTSLQHDGFSPAPSPIVTPETVIPSEMSHSLQSLPGRKILMFQVIIDSAFARRYFAIYLDDIGQGSLLSFWSAVQELRHADKRLHYQLGMEIYHTYIAPLPAPIKVDKVCIRSVEAFLLGNRGPEVLFEIAEEVERTLEDRHYTGFLVSSTYHAMLKQAQIQGIDFMTAIEEETANVKKGDGNGPEILDSLSLQLVDHSSYARNKLAHLQERLTNKLLALQAIKQTSKADQKIVSHLETEITSLREDHKQLETHVERTWLWSENLTHWRVFVQNVQITQEKENPHLIMFVHLESDTSKVKDSILPSSEMANMDDYFKISGLPFTGWMVVRKLTQLIDLHKKLCQIVPWIKSIELPSSHLKLLFNKQLDKNQLEKYRSSCQNYFNLIMIDEKLNGSELIFAFLSPSPEHLKQIICPLKKSRFSFATLFKSSEGKSDSEDDDVGNLFLDNSGEATAESGDNIKDSIVEPLFAFLEEVCELRGVGKWLRKTLVSFVQITYGKNITRHVHESVQGLLSEAMIVYYLQTLRNSLFVEEDEGTHIEDRTPEETLRTRNEAQNQFVKNLPELLCTLVGQQNAKKGAARLFCTLQHHALNKNLLYNIFEALLAEAFPELQDKSLKKEKE